MLFSHYWDVKHSLSGGIIVRFALGFQMQAVSKGKMKSHKGRFLFPCLSP